MSDTSSFIPRQTPPIDRTPSAAGSFSSESRVDASFNGFAHGTGWSCPPGMSWLECMKAQQQVVF
jgi:hypothetical protein